jgi:hypothetical protein
MMRTLRPKARMLCSRSMSLSSPTHQPQLATPQQREEFFRHLLQDDVQPLQSRIQALQELVRLIERDTYRAGLAAPRESKEFGHPSRALREPAAMYRLVRAMWDELREGGRLALEHRDPAIVIDDERLMAKLVAILVRNALEELHDEISDELMKKLNIRVRNAIYTALHARRTMGWSKHAPDYVIYQMQFIPTYWEQPELLDGYLQSWKRSGEPMDEHDGKPKEQS